MVDAPLATSGTRPSSRAARDSLCQTRPGGKPVQSRLQSGANLMTISMYQASVPLLIRMLANLKDILEKGLAHAQAKKIDEAVFLNARLYPDMFALTRQVQIAADFARATGARLAGQEPPGYEDNEK